MDIEQMAADAAEEAENADTSSLTELGQKAFDLELKIAITEGHVATLKKQLEGLMMHDIPTALSAAGVDEFGFENAQGNTCRIGKEMKVRGTLSNAPNLDEAIDYLEDAGLTGVIRTKVEIDFAKGEETIANNVAEAVALTAGREAHIGRSVHPSTLTSFVKQKLKEDSTFDFEKVGCKAYPQARFTKRR